MVTIVGFPLLGTTVVNNFLVFLFMFMDNLINLKSFVDHVGARVRRQGNL